MTPKRKAAPGQGNGSKVKQTKPEDTFSGKIDASADERHASLLEEAAQILGQSIFRSRFSSPQVSKLEEALRLLLIDGAAFHRFRANHFRRDAGFIFQDRKVA
jgi:hypothetical protein